jgi:hypothetical protein
MRILRRLGGSSKAVPSIVSERYGQDAFGSTTMDRVDVTYLPVGCVAGGAEW